MDADALIALLQQAVPGAHVEPAASIDLRDLPDLAFRLLAELTAVDYWPREPRYEVVYLLVSFAHRTRLRMKVRLAGEDAHVATVSDVWPAANWLEREVWDLMGIAFDGHPDPRRLLMPEQIRMTPHASEPLQVTAEEFRANVERDRLTRQ
jgi:NADH-quinone oxidoreductase subunit C